ncbi:putative OxPP cycle protein OpcA [Hyella patelloides LEGE 07179]|uniref:Putative OxPP cycle protein OpcA n=1 Tax=Hyella patelloides LEGE 07179 TaxID=945734 RepID=A0A563VUT8_9CYAN|nr:glucose-6-phosphate dehydrogenase assembly protein OpcA [Hyella patelloides]VEP15226.1 putative OxPP cycle protein OpcA [Hyella patelloides LEGE 07179]
MVTTKTPIVSLQAPKDVSIEEIEAELRSLWTSVGGDEDSSASRAATFSLIVYEPNGTQQLLAALGFYTGPIDGISGPRNKAAISAAQKAYKMEVTGEGSSQLLTRLEAEFTKAKEADRLNPENKTAAIQYSPDSQGAIADAIASANPCRIIALVPSLGQDEGVKAQVSAYCPVNKKNKESLVCCEYITLSGTAEALDRIGGIITGLTIGELPTFVWWKAAPSPEYGLFKRLVSYSDSMIFDSSSFVEPEANLVSIAEMLQQGTILADLNWRRLSSWQELSAEAFDPPERRAEIYEVDKVTIDYEKGNQSQALMYLGWLASRLNWTPTSYKHEEGDYDLRQVSFSDSQGQQINAELAAIPTADWGDIPGDLISLRLSSTHLDADCCTVLCSSTTGCMRMEAGGGAQSCYVQQVAPLFDQNTEDLLGQQLQRWGREVLYEESMAVTVKILELSQ